MQGWQWQEAGRQMGGGDGWAKMVWVKDVGSCWEHVRCRHWNTWAQEKCGGNSHKNTTGFTKENILGWELRYHWAVKIWQWMTGDQKNLSQKAWWVDCQQVCGGEPGATKQKICPQHKHTQTHKGRLKGKTQQKHRTQLESRTNHDNIILHCYVWLQWWYLTIEIFETEVTALGFKASVT